MSTYVLLNPLNELENSPNKPDESNNSEARM